MTATAWICHCDIEPCRCQGDPDWKPLRTPEGIEYDVIWSGRDELLPEREEHWDGRFSNIQPLDFEEDEVQKKPSRRYVYSGKYARRGAAGRKGLSNGNTE